MVSKNAITEDAPILKGYDIAKERDLFESSILGRFHDGLGLEHRIKKAVKLASISARLLDDSVDEDLRTKRIAQEDIIKKIEMGQIFRQTSLNFDLIHYDDTKDVQIKDGRDPFTLDPPPEAEDLLESSFIIPQPEVNVRFLEGLTDRNLWSNHDQLKILEVDLS